MIGILGMKKMKDSDLDPDVKRRITKICIRTLKGCQYYCNI